MSLFKTVNIGENINDTTDYVEIDLSFEPVGKGSLEPNSSSLLYDTGNLGYLTITNIKCPILTNLYSLSVTTSYNTIEPPSASPPSATEITNIPSLDDESSYLKLEQITALRFKVLIEKSADIPSTITISTKELGDSTFIVVLKGGKHVPRKYYAGEIKVDSWVDMFQLDQYIFAETYNQNFASIEIENTGDYNLDISSIKFQDHLGYEMDYVSFTDSSTGDIINTATINRDSSLSLEINFDATTDRTGFSGNNKWTESVSSYFLPNEPLALIGEPPRFAIPMFISREDPNATFNYAEPKIVITSNDVATPRKEITIHHLYVTAPYLTMDKQSISFLDITEGTENYKEITIKNDGFSDVGSDRNLDTELIIKNISVDHKHTNNTKLITVDHDFDDDNFIFIPGGESKTILLKFEDATYSDDSSLNESLFKLIEKTLTIETNAINSNFGTVDYGGSSGVWKNKTGTDTRPVKIELAGQVDSYIVEKFIEPSFDLNLFDSIESGSSNRQSDLPIQLIFKNSTATNYTNEEIEYELFMEYGDFITNPSAEKGSNYFKFHLVSFSDNLSPNLKTSYENTANFSSYRQVRISPPLNKVFPDMVSPYTWNSGVTGNFSIPMKGYPDNSWYDTNNWQFVIFDFPSNGDDLEHITFTMNVRNVKNLKNLGTYQRKWTIANNVTGGRPKPIANFTLNKTEGLKYTATQTPDKFTAHNASNMLQWWDKGNDTMDHYSATATTVRSIWKPSVNSSGNAIPDDYSHWYDNLNSTDKALFDANKMFHLENFYYDTKGTKTMQLEVQYNDPSNGNNANISEKFTRKISIYDSFNSKLKITPRPYLELSPKISWYTSKNVTLRGELVVYNNSNSSSYNQILRAIVNEETEGSYSITIGNRWSKDYSQMISRQGIAHIPVFVQITDVKNFKTFIKGYDEGKIRISLNDDVEYAVINIVGVT